MRFFEYLSEVFFPSVCVTCGISVANDKQLFCAECLSQTVFTNFQTAYNNEMMDRLISIKVLKNAFAPLYFKKNGRLKELFYKIKYGNRPDIAKKMATYLCQEWQNCEKNDFKVDGICYVPIHTVKLSKRGYNQSEIIAREISESLNIPLLHFLERKKNIETQTHFGRMDRLKNQEGTIVYNSSKIVNHLIIVDDIMTTGATIETCYNAIRLKNANCSISVLTLAVTDSW